MCGIAGLSLSPNENLNSDLVIGNMLLDIESRGRDATGVAWFNNQGTLMVQKEAMKASDFVPFISLDGARNIIAHTRFGTQGSEKDNNNNHPVVVGDDQRVIVGVHNGVIYNDDQIFKALGVPRIGEVDTEAIYAAIAYGSRLAPDGKPFIGDLAAILETIRGSAALAWQEVGADNAGVMHLAAVHSSPLVIAKTTNGSFLFASTLSAIKRGLNAVGITEFEHEFVPDGQYLKVQHGEVVDKFKFDHYRSYQSGYSDFGYGYGYGSYQSQRPATKTVSSKSTDSAFIPSLEPVQLYPHVLHTFLTPILSEVPPEKYHQENAHREHAIDLFLAPKQGEEKRTMEDMIANGGLIRPGAWCRTTVSLDGHSKECYGRVWMLPPTFPGGDYILRISVAAGPNGGGKSDVILVTRKLGEFVVQTKNGWKDFK